MEDYRLSNDYFNIPKASKYAYELPINSQRAITTIYSAKEDFLNAAKDQIGAEYGSVQGIWKKGLGLSAEEIEELRQFINGYEWKWITRRQQYFHFPLSIIHFFLYLCSRNKRYTEI